MKPILCKFCDAQPRLNAINVYYETPRRSGPWQMWRVECRCGTIGKCRPSQDAAVEAWNEPWQAHRDNLVIVPFDDGHTQVTHTWRDRNGARRQVAVQGLRDLHLDTIALARECAMENGYPGHQGGRWNWHVDDVHAWMMKRVKVLSGIAFGALIVLGPIVMIMGAMYHSGAAAAGGFVALLAALGISRGWKDEDE
jgi:hypothetical protein